MNRFKSSVLPIVCLSFLAGCASVSTPFSRALPNYSSLPADSLQAVALELEAAVRAGQRDADLHNIHGITLDTPEIKQALRSRAARIEILDKFLEGGFGYEESGGLVRIIRSSDYKRAVPRGERDRDALLVLGENDNRWTLYEGIMKANNYPRGSLSAIQEIFFKARVEHLPPGMKYETPAGIAVK